MGTETEYGIFSKQPGTFDAVSHSILFINSCPSLPAPQILWDYEHENPLLDMRGFEVEGEREKPDPEYNRLLNKILPNGARLYVDGAHPEYSTPECTNPYDVVAYEKAGDRIVNLCREVANSTVGEDRFVVYKNNTDGKGNSYGHHENYLVSRLVPFERILQQLVPFFVTRQVYAGAGKVGSENRTHYVPYQISQRADFFESLVDINTMVKRPIINTRDEPHADPAKYRRLHVIVGDSNMSEYTTYLKIGTTALVLTMVEEDVLVKGLDMEDPIGAVREISRDPSLKKKVKLTDGREFTAIEIQKEYLATALRLFSHGSVDQVTKDVLSRWEDVLEKLEEDPRQLSREIDWVMKRELITSFMERKGCDWKDPRVALMDLQYHDLRAEKGLYYALERGGYAERILDSNTIEKAQDTPPSDTRAYFRGTCVKKFPKDIYAVSWGSLLFDTGDATIKKILLMEPYKGTEALTGTLFEKACSAKEFLTMVAGF